MFTEGKSVLFQPVLRYLGGAGRTAVHAQLRTPWYQGCGDGVHAGDDPARGALLGDQTRRGVLLSDRAPSATSEGVPSPSSEDTLSGNYAHQGYLVGNTGVVWSENLYNKAEGIVELPLTSREFLNGSLDRKSVV